MQPPPTVTTPHLVLGGARSGKSAYAEALVHSFPPPYLYIATARALDPEMEQRIRLHRERRKGLWETIECPHDLIQTLKELSISSTKPVLVDCVTLWLTNLFLADPPVNIHESLTSLSSLLTTVRFPLVMVSNELGTGIVPENLLARRFRDLAGHANQQIAAACSAATLVVAGLPLKLK